jgi:hypothetical protein
MTEHKPFIFNLGSGDNTILDKPIQKTDIILTPIINYPSISLGYHYFIHRTKESMGRTKNIDSKNKFYYIVNPFEYTIPDTEEDLLNHTKKFFDTNSSDILSRDFYKMWEMLVYFDIANTPDLKYAAIAEGPGSFLQAVLQFREKYNYDLKKDSYYGVTIHPEQDSNIEMSKQFLGQSDSKYPKLINMHKTYPLETSNKFKGKSNGDITDLKTISLFKKEISKNKKYSDLVTADGELNWADDNFQEQEAYQLILGEIIAALRVQNKDGSFVLKIFETFTYTTLKLVYLISSFYKECFICKPLFSRPSTSEKYVVCKGFKYDQVKDAKLLNTKISNLEEILTSITSNLYLQDIYPDLELPIEFIERFKYINIMISNDQQIMINKILTYFDGNNYYGDLYHNYKNNSIEATKWWKNTYFKDKLNISENEKYYDKLIDYNMKEMVIYFNEKN